MNDTLRGGDRDVFQEHTAGLDGAQATVPRYPLRDNQEKGNPDNKPKGEPTPVMTAPPWRVMGEERDIDSPYGNRGQTVASYQSRELGGENLTAIIRAVSPAEYIGTNATNPYRGIVVPYLPNDLLQTLSPVAQLIYGYDGITEAFPFDVSFNQFIKAPFNGNSGRVQVMVQQKYFPLITVGVPAGVTGTWLEASDDIRRNMLFDAVPIIQAATGFPRDGKVKFRGQMARGLLNPVGADRDRSARMLRKFSGFIPQGSLKGNLFRIPVPRGAVAAMLLSDPTADVITTTAGNILFWQQNTADGQPIVNFPGAAANSFIQLRSGTTSIDVTPFANIAGARTVPFEMIYDLGF
jgi:hypothetical protein